MDGGGDWGLIAFIDLYLMPFFSAPHPLATAARPGASKSWVFLGSAELAGSLLIGIPLCDLRVQLPLLYQVSDPLLPKLWWWLLSAVVSRPILPSSWGLRLFYSFAFSF